MKISLNDPSKINKFTGVFKHLKNVSSDINIYVEKERFYTQGMDSSHACLFELELMPEWFSEYTVDINSVIGVNCELIFKVLNCMEDFQNIELEYNEGDKLTIKLSPNEGVKGIIKEFELPLVDIDSDVLEIPDTEYSADIEMSSMEFRDLIEQLSIFGNDISIKCGEKIEITGSGEYGKMKAHINEDDIQLYALEEDTELDLTFMTAYLQTMCSFSKVSRKLGIHLMKDTPLKIQYNIDDVDEESDCKNYIRFFLAPKIEDF